MGSLFVYTVYILHGIFYIQHFFSISKIKLPRVLCRREEIKIKYGHRFKATVHFIWFIHPHIHLKFYLYKSVRKMTCSLGWVIIIKNAHFLPRKWEERDLENVLCEVNSVTSSINTAAFSTLLIIAELCLQIVESVSLGVRPCCPASGDPPAPVKKCSCVHSTPLLRHLTLGLGSSFSHAEG